MGRCAQCYHYEHPKKRLIYPNTDNEAVGWVICGCGSVIKKDSMGCGNYRDPEDLPVANPTQKRRLIK